MEIEIPNPNSININIEVMPFKKFCQAYCGIYCEETKFIKGVFRELPKGNIVEGDNFVAHLVGRGSAEETYKAYLKWFNHTRQEGEWVRKFVSAKWGENE